VSCGYLVWNLPHSSWWRFLGWLLVGLLIYALYGYRNSRQRVA
jgi:APA family basic amino acid/polyamine antiporter